MVLHCVLTVIRKLMKSAEPEGVCLLSVAVGKGSAWCLELPAGGEPSLLVEELGASGQGGKLPLEAVKPSFWALGVKFDPKV